MDCITAQSLISAAMDHEPLDAAALAEAKEHCRTCEQCAQFVRGQLIAKQAPLPAPPADLADRAMALVRAEAERDAKRAAAKASVAAAGPAATGDTEAEASASEESAEVVPIATLAAPRPKPRRRLPRPYAIGGIAAAVVLAFLGAGAAVIFGTRQISPQTTVSEYTFRPATGAGLSANAPAQDGAKAKTALPSAAPLNGTGALRAGVAGGPKDITVDGVVYSQTGPVSFDVTGKAPVGQTTSSLDTTATPTSHQVYGGPTADTVYVSDGSGQTIAFSRVARTYLGQTYVLTAAELTGFGQWPTLPSQIQAPTSADGQPTFLFEAMDDHGVRVYRLATSPITSGIAVAPNGDTGGPMAGDPNWTWWTPVH